MYIYIYTISSVKTAPDPFPAPVLGDRSMTSSHTDCFRVAGTIRNGLNKPMIKAPKAMVPAHFESHTAKWRLLLRAIEGEDVFRVLHKVYV